MWEGLCSGTTPEASVAAGDGACDLQAETPGALLIIARKEAFLFTGMAPVACLQAHLLWRIEIGRRI